MAAIAAAIAAGAMICAAAKSDGMPSAKIAITGTGATAEIISFARVAAVMTGVASVVGDTGPMAA